MRDFLVRRRRRRHLDAQGKDASLSTPQRAHADTLPRQQLAGFVPHLYKDVKFQRQAFARMFKGAFHQERTGCRPGTRRLEAERSKAQDMAADRTRRGALKYRRLTVRASARLPRRRCARALHPVVLFLSLWSSWLRPLTNLATSVGLQPNSTWPRIREPAATVSELAFRSPISWPDSKSFT